MHEAETLSDIMQLCTIQVPYVRVQALVLGFTLIYMKGLILDINGVDHPIRGGELQ